MTKTWKDILVVGHPRSGTRYMCLYLKKLGLKVGHEHMEEHGISSWMFAVNTSKIPFGNGAVPIDYKFRHTIQVIRNPFDAIKSVAKTENVNQASLQFRDTYLNFPNGNTYEIATYSFVKWNERILQSGPELTVKLEECEDKVFNYLKDQGYPVKYNGTPSKDANSRRYKKISDKELYDKLGYKYQKMLEDFYDNIYNKL